LPQRPADARERDESQGSAPRGGDARATLAELRTRRPLRLIHINSAERWVGEAAHSVELCAGLAERGHQVVWAGREDAPVIERARQAGLRALPLRLPRRFAWLGELRDVRALRDTIDEIDADALHAHRGKDHWVAAAVLLKWRCPRPDDAAARRALFESAGESGPKTYRPDLFRTRHVVMPCKRHGFNRWINTRATSQLLAVSKAAAASLEPYWSEARARKVIPSGVDLRRFHPGLRDLAWRESEFGVPAASPLVGLVGRIQQVKGQHVFLEAAKLVAAKRPDVHFACVGSTRNERRAAKLVAEGEKALGKRWRVAGHVDEIERLIASLDVGVVASLGSEGSSRVTLEYLASGVPVVASRVGGIPDVAECAADLPLRFFDPGNARQLADELERAIAMAPSPAADRVGFPAEALAPISRERWLDEFESNYYERLFGL
jgi:glycosyltransferase involved in cell wall biosynthesis